MLVYAYLSKDYNEKLMGNVATQLKLFNVNQDSISTLEEINISLGITSEPNWVNNFAKAINDWSKTLNKTINTLSIFSGAGGLDIGFHDVGFHTHTMVEVENKFVETLKVNNEKYFKCENITCQNIRDFKPSETMNVDFIIGGPPCQTFSAAGRRVAGVIGTTEEKGTLFEEFVRLLVTLSPKGFLFENVYGITGAEKGQAWERIKSAFSDAGYNISYRILDSADYGVSQHRERMFIVGTKDKKFLFPAPIFGENSPNNTPYITAYEALKDVELDSNFENLTINGKYGHLLNEIPPGLNYSFYTDKMGHPNPIFAWRSKFSDFLYKASPDRPVRTLKAQIGQYSGPLHWDNRRFTISEFKRLQSFPDEYRIHGSRQTIIHQIGNSVPPQISRILALSVLEQIFDIELPFKLPKLKEDEVLKKSKRKSGLTKIYFDSAKEAIKDIKKDRKVVKKKKYSAHLSDNFNFIINNESLDNLTIEFEPNKDLWHFWVYKEKKKDNPEFLLEIIASDNYKWDIPAKKILIEGSSLSKVIFTGAWKVLDKQLSDLNIKADLVQLCGYYQYTPLIRSDLIIKTERVDFKWNALKLIVQGIGTREILSISKLAKLLNIPENKIFDLGLFLRELGYEVRNEKTNSQIPDGHMLIPYSFPTLNHQSVQLRKSL